MKFTKISYVKSFNVGSFLNDKIGLEADIEEGDDLDSVLNSIKFRANKMAKAIQDEVNGSYEEVRLPLPSDYMEVKNIRIVEPPQEKRIGVLAGDILSCTDIKILETYRFIKDTNPELKLAYEEQYSKLSNQ